MDKKSIDKPGVKDVFTPEGLEQEQLKNARASFGELVNNLDELGEVTVGKLYKYGIKYADIEPAMQKVAVIHDIVSQKRSLAEKVDPLFQSEISDLITSSQIFASAASDVAYLINRKTAALAAEKAGDHVDAATSTVDAPQYERVLSMRNDLGLLLDQLRGTPNYPEGRIAMLTSLLKRLMVEAEADLDRADASVVLRDIHTDVQRDYLAPMFERRERDRASAAAAEAKVKRADLPPAQRESEKAKRQPDSIIKKPVTRETLGGKVITWFTTQGGNVISYFRDGKHWRFNIPKDAAHPYLIRNNKNLQYEIANATSEEALRYVNTHLLNEDNKVLDSTLLEARTEKEPIAEVHKRRRSKLK